MSNVMWDAPELAERYDRVSDIQFRSGSLLVGRMGVKDGDDVLDVGCGTGRLALHVSQIVGPAGSVTGIDPSPHRIRVAESKLNSGAYPNVRCMIGQGEDMVFLPVSAFDHLYYSSVFHWIEDKATALREAYRVLKPGGAVGMTTVDRSHMYAMRQMWEKVLDGKQHGQVNMGQDMSKLLVSSDELDGLLHTTGFVGIDIRLVPEKHYYRSAIEFIEFIEASSFGNFLRQVPGHIRTQIIDDMGVELEKRRTDAGIELESSTMFAIARKPC
ncbi:MAG: class I SAM-dependent methyltransferase [Methanocella sp.]